MDNVPLPAASVGATPAGTADVGFATPFSISPGTGDVSASAKIRQVKKVKAGAGVYRCIYPHGVYMRVEPSQDAEQCHVIRAQELGEVEELVDGAENVSGVPIK